MKVLWSHKSSCFRGWSIDGCSNLARWNDTDERVSRTIAGGGGEERLMGIVACRLFDGERGESKWGITSTRLRASVFPPQYPGAQWIPIIRECEMADLHVSCWLSGCVYFNGITRAIRERGARAASNKFDPTSGTLASLDRKDFASQTRDACNCYAT